MERAELVDGDGAAGNANANEIGNGLVERAAGVITAVNLTNLQVGGFYFIFIFCSVVWGRIARGDE